MSWLDDLEARLSGELEGFLRANPTQQALVEEQERRDRQERLRRQRLALQQEAEQSRQALLQLAAEIRSWQERVQRARAAGADDLAGRAEAHVAHLMEQGRQRWQQLAELGQRFGAVEWELSQLERPSRPSGPPSGSSTQAATASGDERQDALQDAWAAFEAEQELEALRARLRR